MLPVLGFQNGLVYDNMKYLYRETTAKARGLLLALSLTIGCASSNTDSPSPEEILSRMRADTAWIRRLESLVGIAIGPGAKCIDPVRRTFSYDGRTWLFNEDWGGILSLRGRSVEGTRFWACHDYSGTDRVLFSVLVLYADGREAEAERVIGMAGRYPEGLSGTLFKGLCLQDIFVDHVE